MASSMIPPTAPPPPRPPHRSIAGPVVLILMGVLFLLGTMGILEWHGLGTLFARFWPALLILWGVLKLIEYEQAKRLGQPARGIGVGGVFLMLFLIVAGLIATQAARLNWKDIGEHIQIGDDDEGLDEIFGGSTFNYSDDLTQEIPEGSSLHVNDDRGTITINVGDSKTKMKVSVRKKVRAENEQDAENYNRKTKPQITVGEKVVTLNANTQGAGDKGVTADMDIYVPINTALIIVSGRGDVTIAGMTSNVEINHRRGEVNMSDHTGNISLNLDGSSARLSPCEGRCDDCRKGKRSGGGRCGWRGSSEWRVSGKRATGSSEQDGEFPLVAHRHGVFAPGWQAGSGFRRPARRFAGRADAPDDAVEGHRPGRAIGRSAPRRFQRDGRSRAVQAGKHPDRQPQRRRAGFDSAEHTD